MSHAYAARGARQTAVLAAIVGLHFAVYLAIATGLVPTIQLSPPGPLPITVLPKPLKPKPVAVAPTMGPLEKYAPDPYPEPDVPIPVVPSDDKRTVSDRESIAGETAGGGPVVDYVPPTLRTRQANVVAAINACYPAASRRMNEEGTVIALVTIGAAGSPLNWSVSQSSGFARLDAAIACVLRKLDFVAGRRDGQAVSAEARLPIVFRLH